MSVIIDAHLPKRLKKLFEAYDITAYHTLDLPEQNATSDNDIIAFADKHDCIVITKDADFVNAFHVQGKPRRLLLLSTGNIRNNDLIELLEVHISEVISLFSQHQFVELSQTEMIIHI